jgi:hypothetical protein
VNIKQNLWTRAALLIAENELELQNIGSLASKETRLRIVGILYREMLSCWMDGIDTGVEMATETQESNGVAV